jgi:peptidyl-prolyl cis-trans isomerase C
MPKAGSGVAQRNRFMGWSFAVLLAACGGQEWAPAKLQASPDNAVDAYIALQTGADPASIGANQRHELERKFQKLSAAAAKGTTVPGAQARAEIARLESLAHSAAEAAGVYTPPIDAELQQAYEAYLQTLPASEYHVAHILVANEILANAVIAELEGGEKFADVASKRSADDSKSNGGDLGWIHPGHLPTAFFDALKTLKPGQYIKTPVHTPYGWHVIELIEVRPASPPPFDQVKAQLATNLQQERYQKFLDDSLKASKNSQ